MHVNGTVSVNPLELSSVLSAEPVSMLVCLCVCVTDTQTFIGWDMTAQQGELRMREEDRAQFFVIQKRVILQRYDCFALKEPPRGITSGRLSRRLGNDISALMSTCTDVLGSITENAKRWIYARLVYLRCGKRYNTVKTFNINTTLLNVCKKSWLLSK